MFNLNSHQIKGILFIILALLIYKGQYQLMILGARLGAMTHRPTAEMFLGDRYKDISIHYKHLADEQHKISLRKFMAMAEEPSRADKGTIMFIIGSYYKCGRGVKVDYKKAERWFIKARKNGHTIDPELLNMPELSPSCQMEANIDY